MFTGQLGGSQARDGEAGETEPGPGQITAGSNLHKAGQQLQCRLFISWGTTSTTIFTELSPTPLSQSLYKILLQNAKERANENLSSTQEYAQGYKTPGTGFAYNPNAVATQAHTFT